MGGTEHGHGVGIAKRDRFLPPAGGHGDVAVDAERVMIEETQSGHRGGIALVRCFECPLSGGIEVGLAGVGVRQHPREHVLRLCVPGCRSRLVPLQREGIALRHAFALEVSFCEPPRPGDMAAPGCRFQPLHASRRINLHAQAFHERARSGLQARGLREFQVFIARLDEAIAQQRALLQQSRLEHARQHSQWQSAAVRSSAVGKVMEKARHEERQVEERRAQRELDERAQRQGVHR